MINEGERGQEALRGTFAHYLAFFRYLGKVDLNLISLCSFTKSFFRQGGVSLGAVTHLAIVRVPNARNEELELVFYRKCRHFLPVISTNVASLFVLYGCLL